MGRMNWSRIATRDRMRRQGVEDIKGKMPLVSEPPKKVSEPPKQPSRKLSKGKLRQQTAAAFLTAFSKREALKIAEVVEKS